MSGGDALDLYWKTANSLDTRILPNLLSVLILSEWRFLFSDSLLKWGILKHERFVVSKIHLIQVMYLLALTGID